MSRPQLSEVTGAPVRVVDAHVHFWDQTEPDIAWPMLDLDSRFPLHRFNEHGHYDAADHRAETAGVAITKVVHVQAAVLDDPVVETAWLQRMADRDPQGWPNGIVASGPLWQDGAPAMIERHAQYANFRGIRDPTLVEHLDDTRLDGAFAAMARVSASCDLGARVAVFDDAMQVVDRHPAVTFVLNHAGIPNQRSAEYLAEWRAAMARVAQRPNVVCKVSGFSLGDHDWTVDSFAPMVHTCVDVFGIDRCMFASDWPVDKLHSTYGELLAAYTVAAAAYAPSERDALFAGTAERVYRLD